MSESNDAILQRAYELIENDELEQAQELLAPLLEADADNASLWWVYAHAVRDTAIGQVALERVMELDPAYPGAGELKDDLLQFQSGDDDFVALARGDNADAPVAANLEIDDWEDLQPASDTEAEVSSSRKGFALLGIVLVLVAAGAGLVASGAIVLPDWLSGLLPTPEPAIVVVSPPTEAEPPAATQPVATAAPDQVLDNAEETAATITDADELTTAEPTAAPTEVEQEEPTAEPTAASVDNEEAESTAEPTATSVDSDEMESTAEPTAASVDNEEAESTAEPTVEGETGTAASQEPSSTSAFVSLLAERIDGFSVAPPSSEYFETEMGKTLVIQVCAVPGPEFTGRLKTVMHTAASIVADIPKDADAVGVELFYCVDDEISRLNFIGVLVSQLQQFANQEIDDKEFQRAWQPLP